MQLSTVWNAVSSRCRRALVFDPCRVGSRAREDLSGVGVSTPSVTREEKPLRISTKSELNLVCAFHLHTSQI